ncbi:hypothetical protein FGG08_004496 [Glutinoglossum americanum]|uniref:DM13 domain-containing protein n=1 Tax=Glutinoglossum americanum TaxID=1670608 RepID=A0A9P8KWZ3_9PEZI|nr:hypothetical protein FGG08_004496 [Glutinoglossum americanum]
MLFNASLFLTTTLALFSSLTAAQTPTNSSSSSDATTKPNWSGSLSTLSGGLSGTVKVTSPTTLLIQNFKLGDASAPALYWWGSATPALKSGFRISNAQVKTPSGGADLVVQLDAGKTVADFSTVGLWCERFGVDFGQAVLSADGSAGAPAATGAATGSGAPKAGAGTAVSVPVRVGFWAGVMAAGWVIFA